jgi:nucleotide-binding universal stress UspA family protein
MRIGVGYDGSPESTAALAAARQIAAETKGSVRALQIVTIPSVMYTGLMPPLLGESVDTMIEEARGRMEGMPGVEGRAVYGVPGEELSAFGDELDLLVVGSRNFGPVRRRVVGSTCDYLERHARCSLLTLPRVDAADGADGEAEATSAVAV